jgi:hypothetical protein
MYRLKALHTQHQKVNSKLVFCKLVVWCGAIDHLVGKCNEFTSDIYIGLRQNELPTLLEHDCRYTVSINEHSRTPVGTSRGTWTLFPGRRLGRSSTMNWPRVHRTSAPQSTKHGGYKISITSSNFWCRMICYKNLQFFVKLHVPSWSHSDCASKMENAITLSFSQYERFLNKKLTVVP